MRMYGGDAAIPLPLVTLKAEAGVFHFEYPAVRRVRALRAATGAAARRVVVRRRLCGPGHHRDTAPRVSFSPVRGSTRAFVARAGYTIDINRSVAFETVIRQNGRGMYLKPEYTQAFGQHWRVTAGFALIRGSDGDFLGQYHRNSHGILTLRYSF